VDPSAILYSDSGQFDLDTSDEALLQEDTAPDNPTLASSVMTSLWTSNEFVIKASRWLAWLRAVSGSVAYMTVTY
jgi:hypothetical protein